ncbi:MAG TPA: TfuA-like protein, partial [Polyangiales bacterium]|nr:TfuA-like protein [Polyangiales bacterium]
DDEVAVLHADESLDYQVKSDALVNIRATLAAACAHKVLSRRACRALIAQARGTFYAERSYERLLSSWPTGARAAERRALSEWLRAPERRIDLKHQDALELIRHVRAASRAGTLATPAQAIEFPVTDAWVQIQRAALARPAHNDNAAESVSADELLEEAQLSGAATFEEVVRVATWRALCLALAQRGGAAFDMPASSAPLAEDAAVVALSPVAHRHVTDNVPGALRVLHLYDALAARARAKRRLRPSVTPARSQHRSLLRAYFRLRWQQTVPRDIDACAQRMGFADRAAFLRALATEVAYLQEVRAGPARASGSLTV